MPYEIPVATVALNGAKNAGILAAKIIASSNPALLERMLECMDELKAKVIEGAKSVKR